MAAYTKNLNLIKPLQDENYNVDIVNDNADKIDAAVQAVRDDVLLKANIKNPTFTGIVNSPKLQLTYGSNFLSSPNWQMSENASTFNFRNTNYGDTPVLNITTSYIKHLGKDLAYIDSPKFTGIPNSPTPPVGDNSARIATTEFVNKATYTEELISLYDSSTDSTKTVLHSDLNDYTEILIKATGTVAPAYFTARRDVHLLKAEHIPIYIRDDNQLTANDYIKITTDGTTVSFPNIQGVAISRIYGIKKTISY